MYSKKLIFGVGKFWRTLTLRFKHLEKVQTQREGSKEERVKHRKKVQTQREGSNAERGFKH